MTRQHCQHLDQDLHPTPPSALCSRLQGSSNPGYPGILEHQHGCGSRRPHPSAPDAVLLPRRRRSPWGIVLPAAGQGQGQKGQRDVRLPPASASRGHGAMSPHAGPRSSPQGGTAPGKGPSWGIAAALGVPLPLPSLPPAPPGRPLSPPSAPLPGGGWSRVRCPGKQRRSGAGRERSVFCCGQRCGQSRRQGDEQDEEAGGAGRESRAGPPRRGGGRTTMPARRALPARPPGDRRP